MTPQTAFGLSGQTQPGLPNGQAPQVPASTEAVSREGKPHVSIEGKAATAQVLALCQGQDSDQESQHCALGYRRAGGKGLKERRDEERQDFLGQFTEGSEFFWGGGEEK